MRSAIASLVLDADVSGHYRLPAGGTSSLLFVFDGGHKLGARVYSASGEDFEPGSSQSRVRLEFWADDPWTDVVKPGATFTIWYGGDVGHGEIIEIA